LSIIDLDTGSQPIVEDGGARVLLGNGEIYNFVELRQQFADYPYRTKGDMETVLPAFAYYGDDFVNHLNGMYSLALYERDIHRLTLVRDRLGVKPIFWAELPGGGVVFASEIKALFIGGLVEAAIDESSVNAYLAHGYVPSPATLFAGIHKLPPGHRLTVDARGEIRVIPYWRPAPAPDFPGDLAEAEKYLLDLLDDSVRLQLRSDVPVGVLLSGGVDSGLLVALAAKRSQHRLNTFTVSFEGALFDEAPLARQVAERYDTNHTEVTVGADSVGDELIRLAWFAEEPLNDAALLPNYLIEKTLGAAVKVALNGTGGDELFAGYGRYFQLPVERRYMALPSWLRRGLIEPAAAAVNPMRAWQLSRARLYDGDRGAYIHAHSTHFPPPVRALIGNRMTAPEGAQVEYGAAFLAEHCCDEQTAGLYSDIVTYLPEDLLTVLDRTSMAVGVEGRVPFLDHRLVEAALAVPESWRTPDGRQKALERSMAARFLPEAVIDAPKRGFQSPVPHWMRAGLGGSARQLLTRPQSLERGWWTGAGIETLLADPARHGYRIYSLMMLELAVRLFSESPLETSPPTAGLTEFAAA
jgi:asparagine synthase (glutamine-hydrolysing)